MRQHVSPELRLGFWEEIPEHLYDTAKTNATRRPVFFMLKDPLKP